MTRPTIATLCVQARRADPATAFVGLLTLLAALGLKHACGTAGADALLWVLTPSCWLANHLGGLDLVREGGAGFITHHPRMVVGPACAGVNFFVISWLASYFTLQGRFAGMAAKSGLTVGSAIVAYGVTIATNGLRIALAAKLYGIHLDGSAWTPARLHRLLGVVLYVSVLLALCRAGERLVRIESAARRAHAALASFGWYVGVAVVLPLLNRASGREPGQFVEHATTTVGVGTLVLLVFLLVDRLGSRGDASA